jgi:2-desacetyl-2-hydroxyethyl bacteriochlorophyllide A dehydrogenase
MPHGGDGIMLRYIEFQAPNRAVMARAPLPIPAPDEALIETVQSGISLGTERMWLDGSAGALRSGRRGYPYRPGYELIGRVAAAGPEFTGAAVGGRVFAMKPHGSHALIKAGDLWLPLPNRLDDDDALAIALTATALHAVHRSTMTVGDGAVVAGLGTLGLIMLQVLAATMAGPVVALTGTARKAALAVMHGAAMALTYDELPDWRGSLPEIQTVFECSGVAANVARVLPLARAQGEIVLSGFYTEPIQLDGETLFAHELTVKGVRGAGGAAADDEYNRWNRRRNLALAGKLVAAGKVRTRHLVTHRFAAERFDEAYRLIADRERSRGAIRVCLSWRE